MGGVNTARDRGRSHHRIVAAVLFEHSRPLHFDRTPDDSAVFRALMTMRTRSFSPSLVLPMTDGVIVSDNPTLISVNDEASPDVTLKN